MQKSSLTVEERKLAEKPPDDVSKNLWEKFKSVIEDGGTWKGCDRGTVCIVIDDNMYYRSMRHSYYQLARKCKHQVKVFTILPFTVLKSFQERTFCSRFFKRFLHAYQNNFHPILRYSVYLYSNFCKIKTLLTI